MLIDAAFMRPGHIVFGPAPRSARYCPQGYPVLSMGQRDRDSCQRERNEPRRDRSGDGQGGDGLCYSFSGVVLRRTGFPWDIRIVQGYDSHDQVEFNLLVGKNGDCCESSLIVMPGHC
jgi:hypothetical protein